MLLLEYFARQSLFLAAMKIALFDPPLIAWAIVVSRYFGVQQYHIDNRHKHTFSIVQSNASGIRCPIAELTDSLS